MVAVDAPRLDRAGDRVRLSAVVHAAGRRHHVGFETASEPIATGVEPFVAVALLPAMRLGATLRVAGGVSPRLLGSLPAIQETFCRWDPTLSVIALEAAGRETEPSDPARGVGTFFSGGVDSFHTLFTHLDEITDLVFVHGFDIPVHDRSLHRRAVERCQHVADALGKRLVRVATDVRLFSDRYAHWGAHEHGPALAAVGLLLSPRLRRVYVPGEYFPPDSVPRGSHPEVDPLWSTESVTIVHDGVDVTRPRKLLGIGSSELVRRALRVCWENRGGAYNCCVCSKCVRNMAILRACGVLAEVTSFHRPLDLRLLRRLRLSRGEWRDMLAETLAMVEARGTDAELARALRDCLSPRPRRGVVEVLRRAFRGGRRPGTGRP